MRHANKPEAIDATCTGKERMAAQSAKKAAKRIKGRHAYRCKYCKGWHVGNGQSGGLKRKRLSLNWDKGNIDA